MYNDINDESIKRLLEVKNILQEIEKEVTSNPYTLNLGTSIKKGLFFILLYGALEYTLTECVQRCLTLLNNEGQEISNFKHPLLSIILHNECNAVMDAKDKKWTKRYDLFIKLNDTTIIDSIDNTLFPTSTGNIKHKQLSSIWKIFDLQCDIMPENSIIGYLNETTNNRNEIAHGRTPSSEVGGRYTITDLKKIFNGINKLCTHILIAFKDYIQNKHFLKTT